MSMWYINSRRRRCKGKEKFIKRNMARDIKAAIKRQAFIAFVLVTVSQKCTGQRAKIEFMGIIGSKTREATTAKGFKKMIVRLDIEEFG